MAGREAAGFGAADRRPVRGRPWVIVPAGPARRARRSSAVVGLATACGARADPADGATEHDAAVAAISHLPLVVAAALVEAVMAGRGRDWRPAGGDGARGERLARA